MALAMIIIHGAIDARCDTIFMTCFLGILLKRCDLRNGVAEFVPREAHVPHARSGVEITACAFNPTLQQIPASAFRTQTPSHVRLATPAQIL
jgi:hypothetical protein